MTIYTPPCLNCKWYEPPNSNKKKKTSPLNHQKKKKIQKKKEKREMISDPRKNGEERDDELQYEYSSSISDAESCSSDSEDDAISDQNQQSDSRKLDASGPLYDLSSLVAQLPNPNKRGLSKYYDGKSQSFTSLSDAKCKEDLPKKESPYYKRKIKPSKSYADGLFDKNEDASCNHNPSNKDITRTSSRGSCGNLLARNSGRNMLCRPPTVPLNKN